MSINPADEPFGRVVHLSIYDIGTDILLADGSKGITETILNDVTIVHDMLENTGEKVGSM